MKKIICFSVCVFFWNALAQAETLYQVELIAFARTTNEAENEENWDRQYNLRYPERYVNLQPSDSGAEQFQQLGADVMQLNREADIVANRRNWHLLLHTAWRQSVDDPAHATSVVISGGKQFGIHHELEGTFTLSVEHFLRADAHLWLSRFANSANAVAVPLTITLPNPPGAIAAAGNDATQYVPIQTVVLQEQRRLRSGEVHYFDHPRFGLIVLVTPVANPQ